MVGSARCCLCHNTSPDALAHPPATTKAVERPQFTYAATGAIRNRALRRVWPPACRRLECSQQQLHPVVPKALAIRCARPEAAQILVFNMKNSTLTPATTACDQRTDECGPAVYSGRPHNRQGTNGNFGNIPNEVFGNKSPEETRGLM
jgi:hypothetical protein